MSCTSSTKQNPACQNTGYRGYCLVPLGTGFDLLVPAGTKRYQKYQAFRHAGAKLVPVPEGTPDVRIKAPRSGAKTGTTGVARSHEVLKRELDPEGRVPRRLLYLETLKRDVDP